MEYHDALKLLRERLDECLIRHAESADLSDVGEIYRLQAYSETQFYLKAVHDYTPAEVEALLTFVDPLEVAFWCREENKHEVGLPICEILQEINADARFEKYGKPLSLVDKTAKLIERLEASLKTLICDLMILDSTDIGRHSERIAAKLAAYRYTTDELMRDAMDESMIDYLLGLDNPLGYITDRWPECTLYGEDVMKNIKEEIAEYSDIQERVKSVRDRLKDAQRKAADQPKTASTDPQHSEKETR